MLTALAWSASSSGATGASAVPESSACTAVRDNITVRELARGVNVVDCDAIGSRVKLPGNASLEVPDVGDFAGIAVDSTDEASYTVTIRVDEHGMLHSEFNVAADSPQRATLEGIVSRHSSGTLTLTGGSSANDEPTSESLAPVTRCQDNEYDPKGYRWYASSTTFYVNGAQRKPSNLSTSALNSAATSAGNRWDHGTDSCGLSGSPSGLDMDSVGSTTRDADISGMTCQPRDGYNVVDWGSLSGQTYGLTCWWGSGLQLLEFDIRMDSSGRSWRLNTPGCTNSLILIAGMMHEMGHAVGLDHVTERGGSDLTMSPVLADCNSSAQYLGKGDHTGILWVY